MDRITRSLGRRGVLVAAASAMLLLGWTLIGVRTGDAWVVVERAALGVVLLVIVMMMLEARRRQIALGAAVRQLATRSTGAPHQPSDVVSSAGAGGRRGEKAARAAAVDASLLRIEQFARHAIETVAAMERLRGAESRRDGYEGEGLR